VRRILAEVEGVRIDLHRFDGPHLTPTAGAYNPLDFLRVGITEKLERDVQFLLMVTEVDLAATTLSYTMALASPLTNIGVVSLKRLDPAFWGEEPDEERTVRRLAHLLLHIFGHLVNLRHAESPENVMYDLAEVGDLEAMRLLEPEQVDTMRRELPREAHERSSTRSHLGFALRMLWRNRRSILHSVARANPFRLTTRLPTMITAALSVIVVVFFSAEVWDVGSTVELYQIVLFSVLALLGSTAVLYRAFDFRAALRRGRVLSESTVVTAAATGVSLFLTVLVLFALFATLAYLATVTIFPAKLMETWPTVDPAVRTLDHVKLSLFVAALGTLAGSLGGRADGGALARSVLFLGEET
jgi:hypothetical protein